MNSYDCHETVQQALEHTIGVVGETVLYAWLWDQLTNSGHDQQFQWSMPAGPDQSPPPDYPFQQAAAGDMAGPDLPSISRIAQGPGFVSDGHDLRHRVTVGFHGDAQLAPRLDQLARQADFLPYGQEEVALSIDSTFPFDGPNIGGGSGGIYPGYGNRQILERYFEVYWDNELPPGVSTGRGTLRWQRRFWSLGKHTRFLGMDLGLAADDAAARQVGLLTDLLTWAFEGGDFTTQFLASPYSRWLTMEALLTVCSNRASTLAEAVRGAALAVPPATEAVKAHIARATASAPHAASRETP